MISRMQEFLRVSAEITASIWLPIVIWTLLAAGILLVMKYRNLHVQYNYHFRLALLYALPLGLLLSVLLDGAAAWLSAGGETTSVLRFIVVQSPLEILSTEEPVGNLSSPAGWYGVGFAVYLSGILLLAIRFVCQYLQLGRLARNLNLLPIEQYKEVSSGNRSLAARAGRPVNVACVDQDLIPVTFGVRNPVILLPSCLIGDPEKLNLALRHELVHILNRDYLSHLLVTGIRVLFWFHPFVLLIYRQLIEYREMRCDSQVLSDATISPKNYSLLLLELLTLHHLNKNLSVQMAGKPSKIKRRIHMIHSNSTRPVSATTGLLLFTALALTTVLAMACTEIQPHNMTDQRDEVGKEVRSPRGSGPLENALNQEGAYVVVEEMPELIGGLSEIQSRIEYPRKAREQGIEGRVYVQFVVTEQGNVINEHIIRGIGGGCDEAALEAVRQAKFKPGRQRGEPVPVQYSLPIVFRLGEA